ncbi:MAG: hypothetical protein UZ12_BCD005000615 [Bacteroidetes bacterium OLB12]|nr:MAG: hypothetical protein UZ12_BCD005000615 [Bacteroidetes bacterium OLB12]
MIVIREKDDFCHKSCGALLILGILLRKLTLHSINFLQIFIT